MSQSLSYLIQRLKPYWLDVGSAMVAFELNRITHFPAAQAPAEFYDKDEAGLIAALASAALADYPLVLIPPCTITLTGVITIPDNTEVYGRGKEFTIIEDYGFIMGTAGDTSLANLSVIINRASAGDIVGVENSITGVSSVEMCNIEVTNSGAGNAYAVSAENALAEGEGEMHIKDCYLYGVAAAGSGYAGRSTGGLLKVFHSRAYGSTDRFTTT